MTDDRWPGPMEGALVTGEYEAAWAAYQCADTKKRVLVVRCHCGRRIADVVRVDEEGIYDESIGDYRPTPMPCRYLWVAAITRLNPNEVRDIYKRETDLDIRLLHFTAPDGSRASGHPVAYCRHHGQFTVTEKRLLAAISSRRPKLVLDRPSEVSTETDGRVP